MSLRLRRSSTVEKRPRRPPLLPLPLPLLQHPRQLHLHLLLLQQLDPLLRLQRHLLLEDYSRIVSREDRGNEIVKEKERVKKCLMCNGECECCSARGSYTVCEEDCRSQGNRSFGECEWIR